MRRHLILATLAALITGCGSDDAADRSSGGRSAGLAEQPHHAQEVVGRWRVAAHVEPREVGPLAFSVASLQAGRRDKGRRRAPLVRGKLGFRNTGDAPILLKPIDYSAFSKDAVTGTSFSSPKANVATG